MGSVSVTPKGVQMEAAADDEAFRHHSYRRKPWGKFRRAWNGFLLRASWPVLRVALAVEEWLWNKRDKWDGWK